MGETWGSVIMKVIGPGSRDYDTVIVSRTGGPLGENRIESGRPKTEEDIGALVSRKRAERQERNTKIGRRSKRGGRVGGRELITMIHSNGHEKNTQKQIISIPIIVSELQSVALFYISQWKCYVQYVITGHWATFLHAKHFYSDIFG
jgi:hypothetical protein